MFERVFAMQNWNVYRCGSGALVVDRLSEEDAKWMVDSVIPGTYYAVNPNGVTYPAGRHDDGDHDPAFGDLNG